MKFQIDKGRALASAAVFLALLSLTPAQINAQVTGATLSGTVTDAQGAGIPAAKISIKDTKTGVVRDISTDAAGFFSAPNLLPDTYDVTAGATGFATLLRSGITLTVGGSQTLNMTLQVGQISETVEIKSETPPVQLATSLLAGEANSTTVRELPLNGRDWTTLATLQPGVLSIRAQASTGSTSNRGNRGFGDQLADAGHRPTENSYRVNGINTNDYSNGSPGSVLGVNLGADAIQEFSVLISNYTAEYGRTSGAVVNAIMKSGNNQLHGDSYFFFRDKIFDARNFFDYPKPPDRLPPFRRSQFGASAGGPIRKDKTFIFGDYEGVRQNVSQTFVNRVPSAAARAGNLCSIPDATCSPTTVSVDPRVQPYLALWPLPNGGLIGNGDTGFFNTAALSRIAENYFTLKVDHHISDMDNLSGSYFFDTAPQTNPNSLATMINGVFSRRQMASLEETHTFSPRLVNSFRAGFSRIVGIVNNPVQALNPATGDQSLAAVPGNYAPSLSVTGITGAAALGSLSFFNHHWNSYQLYDDAFLTRGTHSVKFGFAFERMQYNLLSRISANGAYTFTSIQNLLTDRAQTVQVLDPKIEKTVETRQSLFAGYVQDDWRVSRRLTLNLGVRYEMTTLPTENHNAFQFLTDFYTGVPVAVEHPWASNPTIRNFAPRTGFAFDPFGNGKTAVRGAFGFFDVLPLPYLSTFETSEVYPFALRKSLGGGLPVGAFPFNGIASLLATTNLAAAGVRYIEQNPHRNYGMNWNFNIQRQLTDSTTVMVGYTGSHTVHQPFTTDDSNMVLPAATTAGYLFPLPVGSGTLANRVTGFDRPLFWDGSSKYNGLQAQVNKRMGHGIQAQGSYTWSKCLDSGSGGHIGDPFLNSITSLPFYNRGARNGPCDFNISHNFVGNYVWVIPSPKLSSPVASWVAGGWQLGGVFTASTGVPFSVRMGGDPLGLNSSDPVDFPTRLVGAGCASAVNPGNVNNYLKLDCFSPPVAPASFAALCQPAAAAVAAVIPNTCLNLFGNAGRNQLTGPGLINFDFSVFKNNPIRRISESANVQFRAEFFNLFNHANFQAPIDNSQLFSQTGTPVAGAGAIDSTTTTSRQIQLAVKLIW